MVLIPGPLTSRAADLGEAGGRRPAEVPTVSAQDAYTTQISEKPGKGEISGFIGVNKHPESVNVVGLSPGGSEEERPQPFWSHIPQVL